MPRRTARRKTGQRDAAHTEAASLTEQRVAEDQDEGSPHPSTRQFTHRWCRPSRVMKNPPETRSALDTACLQLAITEPIFRDKGPFQHPARKALMLPVERELGTACSTEFR